MARMKNASDLATLQMALIGYEVEKQKMELRIREIKAQLKGKNVGASTAASSNSGGESKPTAKRVLSPAARRRIAAAQKKRWAEHRKRAAAAAKSA